MRLQGKTVIITGAGLGIGRATALRFAQEGAKLILTDINEVHVKKVCDEAIALGAEALYVKHDVGCEADWERVVKIGVETFKTIDVLFNNAGIYMIKPITDISVAEWEKLMNVNVTGTFLGMKHVIPVMKAAKKGSIINASSIAGLAGASGHALYGASKGAVRIMSKDVAAEYAPFNIRVNTIHPGYIRTDMAEYGAKNAHISTNELGKAYPMGRIGEVSEVANMVLFLASDESSFTTASEFSIDGGIIGAMAFG